MIIVKSLMPKVVSALYHDLTSPDTNPPTWALSERVWLFILMIVLLPLVFLRKLDSLRHTSYIALFSVGASINFILHRELKYLNFYTSQSSISGRNSCRVLLLPPGRHRSARRDPSYSFHVKFRFHLPSPGVRLYVRPERTSLSLAF